MDKTKNVTPRQKYEEKILLQRVLKHTLSPGTADPDGITYKGEGFLSGGGPASIQEHVHWLHAQRQNRKTDKTDGRKEKKEEGKKKRKN